MRPVNQLPLSLKEMKRSPLASSRHPDSPPKPGKAEVRSSPLRYLSLPNWTREWSRVSNAAIGLALIPIETGAAAENSPVGTGFGGCVASCARATSAIAASETPAAVILRKRRRLTGVGILLRMQPAPAAGQRGRSALG